MYHFFKTLASILTFVTVLYLYVISGELEWLTLTTVKGTKSKHISKLLQLK